MGRTCSSDRELHAGSTRTRRHRWSSRMALAGRPPGYRRPGWPRRSRHNQRRTDLSSSAVPSQRCQRSSLTTLKVTDMSVYVRCQAGISLAPELERPCHGVVMSGRSPRGMKEQFATSSQHHSTGHEATKITTRYRRSTCSSVERSAATRGRSSTRTIRPPMRWCRHRSAGLSPAAPLSSSSRFWISNLHHRRDEQDPRKHTLKHR